MKTYIDIVHDFQLLEARARMGLPLYEQEEAARSGLVALLRGEDGGDSGKREWPRVHAPMMARFSESRGFGMGRLHDISAGGLCLRTATPPALGAELLVYLDNADQGLRYVLPARVVWRRSGTALGAAFEGMPSRVTLTNLRARSFTPSGVFSVATARTMASVVPTAANQR